MESLVDKVKLLVLGAAHEKKMCFYFFVEAGIIIFYKNEIWYSQLICNPVILVLETFTYFSCVCQ